MNATSLRVAMAQLAPRVGDIEGNAGRIVAAAEMARDRERADIVVTPALALVGCPADDLLLRRGLPPLVAAARARLLAELSGITAVIGYPEFAHGRVYDAALVIRDGERVADCRRQNPIRCGIFDDHRCWQTGAAACVFEQAGHGIGVVIGEDLYARRTVAQARSAGAELLLGLEAVPFHPDQQAEREARLADQARHSGLSICGCNSVGGQDELVFAGLSCAFASTARLAVRAPAFESVVHAFDWSPARTVGSVAELPAADALVYDALVCATRDYVENNGFPGVLIGASGGIDSALVLAVAADALGADRVWAVGMPSRYTAEISNLDAAEQARRLGVRYDELSIEQGFTALLDTLSPLFADLPPGTAEENLQARLRGTLLMSLSNKFGHVVLATANKSESAVGYSTLYGDMCGGFAPLKDVYKTRVYRLARYRNKRSEVIPERVLTRPPSAELRAGQADSDSLPAYEVLDAIIAAYVEDEASVGEICEAGHDEDAVRRVVNLIRRSEYKRRQAAPGPKVTRRAFGRDRRYPITAVYGDI